MRVLAVDDDRTSLIVTQSILRRLGHDCVIATDGIEAWHAYRSYAPEVVVSDWAMPGLSGLQLCRDIRSSDSGTYTYFILVTGRGDVEDVFTGMEAGADDYLVKPLRVDDLRTRLVAATRVTELHLQLALQRTELVELNDRLNAMTLRDPLTGVGNRRALEADLDVLEARVARYGLSYCVALIDVDCFKSFNDTYGHQAGDGALQAVATQLEHQTRTGDAVYRYGGDEFLCLYPEQSIALARIAVERIRGGVEHLGLAHAANPLAILTVSAGLARIDPTVMRPSAAVLKEADDALYRAKELGRNCISDLATSVV